MANPTQISLAMSRRMNSAAQSTPSHTNTARVAQQSTKMRKEEHHADTRIEHILMGEHTPDTCTVYDWSIEMERTLIGCARILPNEIFWEIAQVADLNVLCSFSRVCRDLRPIAERFLYRNLVLGKPSATVQCFKTLRIVDIVN